jgi:transcriptional regulator with XRE-family HTH domain
MTLLDQILEEMPQYHRRHARIRARIAKRIRSLLEQEGMKQKDLAEKTGVNKSYISYILSAGTPISTETIAKLEAALGRDIMYVYDPEEDERPFTIGPGPTNIRLVASNDLPNAERDSGSIERSFPLSSPGYKLDVEDTVNG